MFWPEDSPENHIALRWSARLGNHEAINILPLRGNLTKRNSLHSQWNPPITIEKFQMTNDQ